VRNCTCVGSCKGAAGLCPGWVCALEAEVVETTASSPDEEIERRHSESLEWALDNIYTIARREARRGDPRSRWGHVIRLCEDAGCRPRGVLRDNGGSATSVDAVDPVGERVTE
jgi:hypothetical protein